MKYYKTIIAALIVALLPLFSINCATATISREWDIGDFAVPISATTENVPVGTTLDIKAKSAILLEPYSGQILYEMNGDEVLPPASITKIMTAILAIESNLLEEDLSAYLLSYRRGGVPPPARFYEILFGTGNPSPTMKPTATP